MGCGCGWGRRWRACPGCLAQPHRFYSVSDKLVLRAFLLGPGALEDRRLTAGANNPICQ